MKTITTKTKVFEFNELSATAQNNAIELNRDININGDYWSDTTIEDFKEIGAKFGLDIDNIYFSGFWSQGDGACFTGNYEYKKGALKAIKKEYPNFIELHEIIELLQKEQKRFFYNVQTTIENNGSNYSHENSVTIDSYNSNTGDYMHESCTIGDTLRDFMRLIYTTLEKEYNCATNNDTIKECLINNEYDFLESGELY